MVNLLIASIALSTFVSASFMDDSINTVDGEISMVAMKYYERPTKNSYHYNDSEFRPELSVSIHSEYKNLDLFIKASNRLDDSPFEQFSLEYNDRRNNHVYRGIIGTVDSFRGVFDGTKNSNEQVPGIFINSAIYNNEFVEGALETTTGIYNEYSYLLSGTMLFTVGHTYGKSRTLNKTKAEQALLGYESQYVDVGTEGMTEGIDLKILYKNSISVFWQEAFMEFKISPTHSMTYQETIAKYLSDKDGFDRAIFASLAKDNYRVKLSRYGLTYHGKNLMYGYEHIKYTRDNDSVGVHDVSISYMHYLSVHATDHFTPYISYGKSQSSSNSELRYEEHIIGGRYIFDNGFTFLLEAKQTYWTQRDTLQDHLKFLESKKRRMRFVATEIIYSF